MRAHRQRHVLWLLDGALAVGLVALLAWILLDVRPAAADPDRLRPSWADQAVTDVRNTPRRPSAALRSPVSATELGEIDRPEFRVGRTRFHWLYSGPTPPPPPQDATNPVSQTPIQDDLGALGRVRLLVFIPPPSPAETADESVLTFEFTDGAERRAFTPGEFIRPDGSAARGGIRFLDVTPIDRVGRRYAIHYAVHETDENPPVKTGIFVYNAEIVLGPALAPRVRPPRGRAPTPGAGASPSLPRAEVARPLPDPKTLRPVVTYPAPDRVHVALDAATYDYLRGVDPDALAKTVKTETARDGKGKLLGVRITGLTPGSPLERFAVKPGDIVVSIDGHPVASNDEALDFVQNLDPATKQVTVVIDRNGRLLTFTVDPTDPRTRRDARALRPR